MTTKLLYCPDCDPPFLDYENAWFYALGWAEREFPWLPDDIRDGKVQDRTERLYEPERLVHDVHQPPTAGHVCRPRWMVASYARYGCLDALRCITRLATPYPQLEDGNTYEDEGDIWAPHTPPFQERQERGFSRLEWITSALLVLDMEEQRELAKAKTTRSREYLERVYRIARTALEAARDHESAFALLVDRADDGVLIWQTMKFLEPVQWALYLDIDDRVPNTRDVRDRGGKAVDYQDLHGKKRVLRSARDAVRRALERVEREH